MVEKMKIKLKIKLLFKKKIAVDIDKRYHSPRMGDWIFYITKTIKCGGRNWYRVETMDYSTIIPEEDIVKYIPLGEVDNYRDKHYRS